VLDFAYAQVPFYRQHYEAHNFSPTMFRAMEDWEKVPIVTKVHLQALVLDRRVSQDCRGIKINTGGTSGTPLEFFIDRHAFAREWAHMHRIWMSRGYQTTHAKLTFRGKHFPECEPIRYNAVHNEYVVNSNCSMPQVADAVARLGLKIPLRWIHGYPSLVAEFATHLSERGGNLSDMLRDRLYGVLLGSEYPAPHYRERIENYISSNVISWYGHSEMAVLARESARGIYTSLPTYGYAEAVAAAGGESSVCRLLATSFDNLAHPFIRYDTGDLVESVGHSGGSFSFKISEGRTGDFVVGHGGRRIALTSLIFGRHHAAFAQLRHLQIRQEQPGEIILLLVPAVGATHDNLAGGFDLADAGIDWRIEILDAPVRTAAGKTPLKVS
jgi:phenylacetate-CoA ligase